jgi:DNA-binding NtrC family response regulator
MNAKAVLIVDDEKNIRLTLSQALVSASFEAETAINGEEALAKLGRKEFGLVLLDLKMPGMDGMEVLARLRRLRPDIKVIIITAHGTIESAVDAMKLGVVDFIQKPFAPAEIRELCRRVLDRDVLTVEKAHDYESHIELAKKCMGERKFDAAAEHVRQAIAADPSQAEAFNLLGAICEIRGNVSEARKNYRAALALDPTYAPAEANLGRTTGPGGSGGIDIGRAGKPGGSA